MAHGPAHDAAEDVAPALVGGQDAVRDQEARRAQMVGNDAMAGLSVAGGLVARQRLAASISALKVSVS